MQDVLGSPGMIASFAAVLALEALSLLLLLLNIQIFRSQSEKYRLLLADLGDQSAWGRPGRILMPLYVVLTIVVTAVSATVFAFQPHFL